MLHIKALYTSFNVFCVFPNILQLGPKIGITRSHLEAMRLIWWTPVNLESKYTSKNLNVLKSGISCSCTWTSICGRDFFLVKTTIALFYTERFKPWADSHCYRELRETESDVAVSWMELLDTYSARSSAYCSTEQLLFRHEPMSAVYKLYNKGLSTEPCIKPLQVFL